MKLNKIMNKPTASLTLVLLAAGTLYLSTLGCTRRSPQDVRLQSSPNAERSITVPQSTTRTKARSANARLRPRLRPRPRPRLRSAGELKPGTPEYKKRLDRLTDLDSDLDYGPGTKKLRSRCGSGDGKSSCRNCERAILGLDAKPRPAAPRPKATGMDPR